MSGAEGPSRLYLGVAVDQEVLDARLPLPGRQRMRRAVLRALGAPSERTADLRTRQMGVYFVSDDHMAEMNGEYRGKAYPTNVLSFPAHPLPPVFRRDDLGSIHLAPGVILREAAEQGKTPQDHYLHMLVHGTLHLLGYDHESEAEAEAMEGLERSILADLGVADPYH